MNLHSRNADGRAEIMTAYAAMCAKSQEGLTPERAKRLMEEPTTDAMLGLLYDWDLAEDCIAGILSSIDRHVRRRIGDEIGFGCVLFSEKYGCLGMTPGATELLKSYNGGSI
jgi:cobalt-precorrin-5B (C1)-methyltransferase